MPLQLHEAEASQKCHLLALPQEIRNEIHRYVQLLNGRPRSLYRANPRNTGLIPPNMFGLFDHPKFKFQSRIQDILVLARTCKQLCEESNEIFYGERAFEFQSTGDLYRYLYMIGPDKRALMTQIHFWIAGNQIAGAFKLLEECKALKHLTVMVPSQIMYPPGRPSLEKDLLKAEGMDALRKIRGMENLVVKVMDYNQIVRCLVVSGTNERMPPIISYHNQEHVQEVARILTQEMRRKVDTLEKVHSELSE